MAPSSALRKVDASASGRDFHLSDQEFAAIAAYVHREAGISLTEEKSSLVHSRLSKRLRALGIPSFAEYLSFAQKDSDERSEMISSLTTNVTSFFRENHHFEMLQTALAEYSAAGLSARIWSAGCSLGAEPYSIAMTVAAMKQKMTPAPKILATDIDRQILARAKSGLYHGREIEGLSSDQLSRYFDVSQGRTGEDYTVKSNLRSLISFNQLNLIQKWPFRQKFDVIFCRNVAIYFDDETTENLWARFAERLNPNGWLFIGHSERMAGPASDLFEATGVTAYRRNSTPSLPVI